jgi:tRNA (adenine22-N1)-methyltransferase
MHLSKRLQMVADCVSPNSLVADVGCDHAYISIYLVENEIAKRSVALDINEGPLQKAMENVQDAKLSDKISIRLSDGLEKLCPGEANSIVIAGMGGILMVQILSNGLDCVKAANELILQPQSEAEKVREYLHKLKFSIYEENMCIDDGKYYVVIHAKKEENVKEEDVNKEDEVSIVKRAYNKYGELLVREKHPVLKEYLAREYQKAKLIQSNLLEHPSEKNNVRYDQIKEELEMLEYALSFYTP